MSEQSLGWEWKPVFGKDYIHPCALHGDDEGWYEPDENGEDRVPYCPDCGKMLNTEDCIWCGANWIHFGSSRDDVCADAMITDSGDLCCAACYVPEEEDGEYSDDWQDDYP